MMETGTIRRPKQIRSNTNPTMLPDTGKWNRCWMASPIIKNTYNINTCKIIRMTFTSSAALQSEQLPPFWCLLLGWFWGIALLSFYMIVLYKYNNWFSHITTCIYSVNVHLYYTSIYDVVNAGDWNRERERLQNQNPVELIEYELTTFIRRAVYLDQSEKRTGNLERSSYLLLRQLDEFGPARVKELAESFKLDISTLSRQAAALEAKEPHLSFLRPVWWESQPVYHYKTRQTTIKSRSAKAPWTLWTDAERMVNTGKRDVRRAAAAYEQGFYRLTAEKPMVRWNSMGFSYGQRLSASFGGSPSH